jgi:hypothetical protein
METKTWIKTKIAQKKFGADNGKNEKMRKKIEDALNYFYNPSLVSEQGKNDLSFITEEIKAKVEEALGSANTMHMGNLSGGLS